MPTTTSESYSANKLRFAGGNHRSHYQQWRNWRGAGGGRASTPLQAKCKNWPSTQLILWYLLFFWFSVRCCCFAFFEAFSANIEIHIRINYHFLTFFWVLVSGPPMVASGPPSAKFPPWLKPLITPQSTRVIRHQRTRDSKNFGVLRPRRLSRVSAHEVGRCEVKNPSYCTGLGHEKL